MKKKKLAVLLSITILGLVVVTWGCKAEDNAPPQITLNGDAQMTITLGSAFTDPGATATDEFDGDITSGIVVTGGVDRNVTGRYTIVYTSTDEAGFSSSVTRTVDVVLTGTAALGTYTTTTTCTTFPYNTVATTTNLQAGSGSDKFIINMFYYNGGTLSCTVSGPYGRNITVDAGQAPNPIGDGVTGTGTFTANGRTLTMNYTFTPNGGSPTSCSVTYTKQ